MLADTDTALPENPSALSPFEPVIPGNPGDTVHWARLYGSSPGLALSRAALKHPGPVVIVTRDAADATRLEYELRFFLDNSDALPLLAFPDWETLPYDVFSPHQDIISQRLETLYHLPGLDKGILIVPVSTLMYRLPPREYLETNCLMLDAGDKLRLDEMRRRLEHIGYRCVSQVMEHGEFAVRGSLIDLYPMGSAIPYRIDLFDDEVESIRTFDPENQRSVDSVRRIRLLPAREFPLTEEAIKHFRQTYRATFEGDPQRSTVYRDVSQGVPPPGIEYYLPLFFDRTHTLFDYLPANSLCVMDTDTQSAADAFRQEIHDRYEQRRHDIEHPLLPPERLFLQPEEIDANTAAFPHIRIHAFSVAADAHTHTYSSKTPPSLPIAARAPQPLAALIEFMKTFQGRILFAAETPGRRETLLDLLKSNGIHPAAFDTWQAFLDAQTPHGMIVAALERGLLLDTPRLAIITETQLFGEHVIQQRRRKPRARDTEAIIRNLTELNTGAPVVHEDHGVGRYLGLQTLKIGDVETEFLTLEYAGGDKLYVPVSSLHLISRYTGAAPEQAPLHKLGADQWQRARQKAAEKARDAAAELLDIYARRAARKGIVFQSPEEQYRAFTANFPFEETPDQMDAINAVIADMTTEKTMDRLVCGDVGFGKTEVAMRAAFLAAHSGKQVAVLVPTTLLAQQHYQNFKDRFADWPIHIESISRFRTQSQQDAVLKGIADGGIDIVIGTHKLLQEGVKFKRLGLIIIDEEHRFGVRQKEQFKALRSEVDILTLTATPIPRTLNMALSGLRELSIIATPPSRRLAVKTFVREWNNALIHEACLREIKRGGQVYFLHNEVKTINKIAQELAALIPEAQIRIAHGQMREKELEQVMLDFYHHRFNILVCTTIIETGIDVPNANTIVVNRADKFGLAQLHQLRGRVGRSYHQAYAFLIIPPRKTITADAIKRLEAIESLEDLGAGFALATNDLEIRGAGEFLGEEQSGHMQEIGYTLYTELLERAVQALKSGREPDLSRPFHHGAEIELHIPALLPEDYLPDVHSRLVMYKRIASAETPEDLDELQVEMIDRFGLLPEQTKNLFRVTALKLKARPLGIRKIEASSKGGRIIFDQNPNIDPTEIIRLIQTRPQQYKFDGQDKLRFIIDLADKEARFKTVEELLDKLAVKNHSFGNSSSS